jgi:hypothetical protein
MDAHKNFAYALVGVAPAPAASGLQVTLEAGGGARMPAVPFNATVCPPNVVPLPGNAEVVRVTNVVGDVCTIVRAQEASNARAIAIGDQFFAAITAKTLTDVEQAVDAVSAQLAVVSGQVSAETAARTAKDDVLSQALSVVSTAVSNVLSIALLASSLAASETSNRVSADNALSQAVSVVSQALSVETAARVAGVNVVSNALSNEISNRVSADNALSQSISVLSQQVSLLSQQASLFSQLRSVLRGGLVSQYLVKNGAGDFAFVWSSVTAGGVGSVTSAQREVLSNQISNETSARIAADNSLSNSISILSQQLSVLSQAHSVLSQAHSVLSQNLSNEISNRTSADNALSQAISVISQQVSVNGAALSNLTSAHNALSNVVSGAQVQGDAISADLTSVKSVLAALSARTTAGTSVHGLQSILNALSSRISQAGGGGSGSVTSTELSAGDQAVSLQAASALSQALSVQSVRDAALSVRIDTQSQSISVISQQLSLLSQAHSAVSQALSNEISNRTSADNALSNAISIISQQVSLLSQAHSVVSNALSNEISNRTSADNALSQAISVISQQASVISTNVSNLLSIVNNVSAVSGAGTAVGLQSVINQLSNRISAIVAGAASATSNEVSIGDAAVSAQAASAISQLKSLHDVLSNLVSNALSAGDIASNSISIISQALSVETANRVSADNALSQSLSVVSQQLSVLSQAHSVLSQAHSVISAGLGLPQMRVIQNAQVISATAFTNVSGLSLSVTSAATYRVEGRILFTTSIVTGTAFGFTYPAGVGPGVMTMEFMANNAGTPGNLTSANYVANRLNETSMSTVATAQMSLVAQLVSATTGELEVYGLIKISATAGAIQLQAKQSAAGGGVQFLPGSYLQAFRVL